MNIVLHEPGIALNTGNIGRTCAATGTGLHLIKPYAFRINEKEIRRAGMDYWHLVRLSEYLDYEDFLASHPGLNNPGDGGPRLWYATTKAVKCYSEVRFHPDDYIMFGNESRGIPEEILVLHPESCIRIPMCGDIRSLNLANSVAIILYEALRQNGFAGMEKKGRLHRLSWPDIPAEP